jgi:cytochrome c-type biogenesis protein CcmH/NrfG
METEKIPSHLSAEEHSILQAEEQLLKDGGQWLKRFLDLYTQTPKIKIWVPVLCSMLITSYYLYSMHARATPRAATTLPAEPTPSVPPSPTTPTDGGVVPDRDSPPNKPSISAAGGPAGAAEDTPASDSDLLQQAQQAHGSKQFADEAKFLQRILEHSPSAQGVCPQIGKAYESAGEIDEAIQSFEQCVSAAPNDVDTLIAYAHTLLAKKDFAHASALYRQCIQKDPENLDARTGIALVELRQNHLHEADQLASAVLHKTPGNTDALLITGIVAFRQARLNDAAQIFSRGVGLDANRADFHAFLGRIAEAQRRPQQALEEYEKALSLDPSDTDIADKRDHLRGTR